MKKDIIFEIPTIENPKIDISIVFGGIPPLKPLPPRGRPWGEVQGGRPFKPKN